MKNKKLLYVLIPGTLAVWGMIIYRIFNTVHPEENVVALHAEQTPVTDEIADDTFSVHPNYRDPFSGKRITAEVPDNVVKKPVAKVIKPIPVTTPWPKIVYGGIIKNQKSNKQLALLQINGESNMMKPGEEIKGIQLLRVFRDSIEVKFLKEKKTVIK